MCQRFELILLFLGVGHLLQLLLFLHLFLQSANLLPKPVNLDLVLLFVLPHLVQILPNLSDQPRLFLHFTFKIRNLADALVVLCFEVVLLFL